jgi:hypothetical protein
VTLASARLRDAPRADDLRAASSGEQDVALSVPRLRRKGEVCDNESAISSNLDALRRVVECPRPRATSATLRHDPGRGVCALARRRTRALATDLRTLAKGSGTDCSDHHVRDAEFWLDGQAVADLHIDGKGPAR